MNWKQLLPLYVVVLPGIFFSATAAAQKKVAEMMLSYDVQTTSAQNPSVVAESAQFVVLLKGPQSRTELQTRIFSTTYIQDARNHTAVALREISGQKILIRLTTENVQERDQKYRSLKFSFDAEKKVIAGYPCQKASAQLADGTQLEVYYTEDLVPENKEYDPLFSQVPGLPLAWTLRQPRQVLLYRINKINFNPVPASRFDIPTSGYREMTYAESLQLH